MTNKTKFESLVLTAINSCEIMDGIDKGKSMLTIGNQYKVIEENDLHIIIINDFNERHIFDINEVPNYFIIIQDPIVENVIEKLRRRASVGISKYGTTLEENNSDDFLKHLQEELLDASNYIEKLMKEQNKYEEIDYKLYKWFHKKELIQECNSAKQFMKVSEELGELSSAIIKQDREKEIDAFGDTLITLMGLSYMRGLNLIKCLEYAWNEIKDRKGKVIDGSFIKN